MKKYYSYLTDDLEQEKKFYAEELGEKDSEYLRKSSELFLIHAYKHLFQKSHGDFEIIGDTKYLIKYKQFHLNLAIGLELLFKSILLKRGIEINPHSRKTSENGYTYERTIQFGDIINHHLENIFPKLRISTIEDIKVMLTLINLRRNNIAHRSKRSHDSYAHEYQFSYLTLYVYEEYFYGANSELKKLLLKSINRSKVTSESVFKPLRIVPKSLRKHVV